MNIIFLDIDGVLNSDLYFKSIKGKRSDTENEIDESRIPFLAQIIKENNAQVVLSSSWRDLDDSDDPHELEMWNYLVNTLEKYEINIMSKTPVIDQIRPLEIKTWLNNRKDKAKINWISIEDDWSEELYEEHGIGGHLIETKFFTNNINQAGLQQEHVFLANRLFKEQERRRRRECNEMSFLR